MNRRHHRRPTENVNIDGYGPQRARHSSGPAESSNDGTRQTSTSSPTSHGKSGRVGLRARLSHFTWAWFECTMSTGALATLLGQQPFTFTGLQTIGKVVFIIDIVLFVAFTALITTRFIMHPRALPGSLHHPMESFYFGAFWVSIALILYGTEQYGVPSCGPWLIKALEVCYWLYATCAFLVTVFQYHVIFDEERLPVSEAMPSWVLPAYPFLLLGPLAGVLLYDQPYSSGLPILIGGICFQGLGWMIAFVMYTIYFTRLVNSPIPIEPKRFAMYVAVGPAAYTSTTFSILGTQASSILPPTYLNLPDTYPTGAIWAAIGTPLAIFFLLFGFFNSALATVSVSVGIRKLRFDLSWWSFVFPNAGLTIALIQIANALDSDGLRGVSSAATIVLCAAWLVIAAMHVRAVVRREVLWPGMDEDEEDVEGHVSRADEEAARLRDAEE